MKAATSQMTISWAQRSCPQMQEWRVPGESWPCLASPSWCHKAVVRPEHAEIPPRSGGSLSALSPHSALPTITISLPHTHRPNALVFQSGGAGLWLPDSVSTLTSKSPSHRGPWSIGFPGLQG